MPRFVTIPEPVQTRNAITDEPLETVSFARSVRVALNVASSRPDQRGGGTHDILTLIDLRQKIDRAEVGSTVELTEDEWKILEGEFRKPSPAFGTAWAFSAEIHVRAILDAPSKKPAPIT